MRNGQQSEVRLDGASETSAQIFSAPPAIQSAANDAKGYWRARSVWISNFISKLKLVYFRTQKYLLINSFVE